MELHESIEHINNQLIAEFGRELIASDLPRFRVVFANDQFEKRIMTHTDEGFELIHPEVRLVPKYLYARNKYILERLIPIVGETDLTAKVSYEPAWTFEDTNGNYLPPRFDVCKFVVEALYSQINSAGCFTKYKDPTVEPEFRKQELEKMEKFLFGNETPTGDALAYGYGVTNPADKQHFEKETVISEKSNA